MDVTISEERFNRLVQERADWKGDALRLAHALRTFDTLFDFGELIDPAVGIQFANPERMNDAMADANDALEYHALTEKGGSWVLRSRC